MLLIAENGQAFYMKCPKNMYRRRVNIRVTMCMHVLGRVERHGVTSN